MKGDSIPALRVSDSQGASASTQVDREGADRARLGSVAVHRVRRADAVVRAGSGRAGSDRAGSGCRPSHRTGRSGSRPATRVISDQLAAGRRPALFPPTAATRRHPGATAFTLPRFGRELLLHVVGNCPFFDDRPVDAALRTVLLDQLTRWSTARWACRYRGTPWPAFADAAVVHDAPVGTGARPGGSAPRPAHSSGSSAPRPAPAWAYTARGDPRLAGHPARHRIGHRGSAGRGVRHAIRVHHRVPARAGRHPGHYLRAVPG